jgi:hypothetical protein
MKLLETGVARLGLLNIEDKRLTLNRAAGSLFALFALFTAARTDDDNHELAVIAALRLVGIQPLERFLKRSARYLGF